MIEGIFLNGFGALGLMVVGHPVEAYKAIGALRLQGFRGLNADTPIMSNR